MVTEVPVPTNRRSMVTPMTPPLAASLRIASSVLQRALRGTSARQFEWVTSDGFRRGLDHVQRGAVAAVRDIDRHAEPVHPRQNPFTVSGEAPLPGIGGAAAQAIVVIGELGHALPQFVERIDVVHRPEVIRILLADDDPEFSLGLGAGNVGWSSTRE